MWTNLWQWVVGDGSGWGAAFTTAGGPSIPAFIPTLISITALICVFHGKFPRAQRKSFWNSAVLLVKHSQPVCLSSVEDRVQLAPAPQRWLCICLHGVCLCAEFILAWKGLNGLVFFLILPSASCNSASLGCAGQHKLFWKRMQLVLPGFVNNSCLFAPPGP